MNPVKLDILIYRGREFSRTLKFFNADGTPMDLTPYTFSGKITRGAGDSAPPHTVEVTSTAIGELTMSMEKTATKNIPFTLGEFEITANHTALGSLYQMVYGNAMIWPTLVP